MTENQKGTLLSEKLYDECFWSALRRLAIFFNSGKNQLCSSAWLKLSDEEISQKFKQKQLDPLLVSYRKLSTGSDDTDRIASDSDRAEHEFYGRFQFQQRNQNNTHITFDCTEVFYKWSLNSLHMPRLTNEDLKSQLTTATQKLISNAATNYLVKNFWHNCVHKLIQGINELNFHEFGGDARYESDFTADNLANIFLLSCYGITAKAKAANVNSAKKRAITDIFELNRCNRVFAERASVRNEETDPLDEFQESVWRFKRQLANSVSLSAITQNAAVTDLAVYFTGRIKQRTDKRGGFYHDGNVIVRLNGIYINSGRPPYLESTDEKLSKERNAEITEFRRERIEEIVTLCCSAYISKLNDSKALREHADLQLESTLKKLT